MDNGELLKDRMQKARVNEEDILQSARTNQGIKSLDDIKYAILEKSGKISILPKEKSG